MKVFMITWVLFCVLVIVGLFIAYATDNLPGATAPVQTEEECSPCEENQKRLKEAMERWEREHKAKAEKSGDTE